MMPNHDDRISAIDEDNRRCQSDRDTMRAKVDLHHDIIRAAIGVVLVAVVGALMALIIKGVP